MKIIHIHAEYRKSIASGENLTVNELSVIFNRSLSYYLPIFLNYEFAIQSRSRQILIGLKSLFSNKIGPIAAEFLDNSIVIIHNDFPAISIRIWTRILRKNIPVIKVIHNYRSTCLSGNHWLKRTNCFKCKKSNFFYGVIKRCYQDDFLSSALRSVYTFALNRIIMSSNVTFVAISSNIESYIKETFGVKTRIIQINNSVSEQMQISNSANDVLFVGRLEIEKGIENLLECWRLDPSLPTLHIVGTGNFVQQVVEYSQLDQRVIFHGKLKPEDIEIIAMLCKISIFPNLWTEPFGRTIAEALSRGQALVATRLGIAATDLLEGENGFFCTPNPLDISKSIHKALMLPHNIHFTRSRSIYEEKYSRKSWEENWMELVLDSISRAERN